MTKTHRQRMKTIVVSAVNIRKGGTLTILRGCLEYLSTLAAGGDYRIVALVHDKALVDYPGIEYIEKPDTIRSWIRRLWCEYVTMQKISKQLSPVHLWFSLHDTTPRVEAERQAVYCQTSFPFLRWKFRDFYFDYKIVLFSLFTRYAYRVNIHRNKYLIVQTNWLRKGMAKMFRLSEDKFIVAPPQSAAAPTAIPARADSDVFTFLYAATPDCHKNFELICKAARSLENEIGKGKFRVVLTINGSENKYAEWLHRRWGNVSSINFAGFMSKDKLYANYAAAGCLIFPSRVETWGLPISEFAAFGKPMLLADLPYAHEASAGSKQTAFFNPHSAADLKNKMRLLVEGDASMLHAMPHSSAVEPTANSWKELFDLLLG